MNTLSYLVEVVYMLKLAQMVQQGKMHNTFGSIKLNANGSIAQTAQVPFSENSSSVVG